MVQGTRRQEKGQVEHDLERVKQQIERGKVRMSDQILRYMTETLTEQLNSENPAEARSVVQRIVKRAEIKNGRLVVHHQSPLTEVSSDLHVYEEVARMEFESMFLP